jgi:hypothetical protein
VPGGSLSGQETQGTVSGSFKLSVRHLDYPLLLPLEVVDWWGDFKRVSLKMLGSKTLLLSTQTMAVRVPVTR